MIIQAKIKMDIENHTVDCENCKNPVILENASPRIMASSNRLVFLCCACDTEDRNSFPVSAEYNLYR